MTVESKLIRGKLRTQSESFNEPAELATECSPGWSGVPSGAAPLGAEASEASETLGMKQIIT